jgi:hypothetical protein
VKLGWPQGPGKSKLDQYRQILVKLKYVIGQGDSAIKAGSLAKTKFLAFFMVAYYGSHVYN